MGRIKGMAAMAQRRRGQVWIRHPRIAVAARVASVLVPVTLATSAAWTVGLEVHTLANGWAVVWWTGIVLVGCAGVLVLEPLARGLATMAVLYEIEADFPTVAPARVSVALRARERRALQRELAGLPHDDTRPERVTERMVLASAIGALRASQLRLLERTRLSTALVLAACASLLMAGALPGSSTDGAHQLATAPNGGAIMQPAPSSTEPRPPPDEGNAGSSTHVAPSSRRAPQPSTVVPLDAGSGTTQEASAFAPNERSISHVSEAVATPRAAVPTGASPVVAVPALSAVAPELTAEVDAGVTVASAPAVLQPAGVASLVTPEAEANLAPVSSAAEPPVASAAVSGSVTRVAEPAPSSVDEQAPDVDVSRAARVPDEDAAVARAPNLNPCVEESPGPRPDGVGSPTDRP